MASTKVSRYIVVRIDLDVDNKQDDAEIESALSEMDYSFKLDDNPDITIIDTEVKGYYTLAEIGSIL